MLLNRLIGDGIGDIASARIGDGIGIINRLLGTAIGTIFIEPLPPSVGTIVPITIKTKSRYPGIPAIVDDRSLAPTVRALWEAVELLTNQRGDGTLAVPSPSKIAELERRLKALEGP